MTTRLLALLFTLLIAGCDLPGMSPDPRIAQREADARAIGGGCRHGLRSIEDCYTLNEKASKSAVFAGWKDMDQYMRDNKIEGVRTTATAKVEPEEETIETGKQKTGTSTVVKSTSKSAAAAPKAESGSVPAVAKAASKAGG